MLLVFRIRKSKNFQFCLKCNKKQTEYCLNMSYFFCLPLVGCVFLFSCKSSPHYHSGNDNKYHAKLSISSGAKYYYTITNKAQTNLSLNDKKVETTKNSEIGLVYEVLRDSTGDQALKITYDKLHIAIKNGNSEQEMDAANPNPFDLTGKLLASIKGSSVFVTLNSKGDILQVTGDKQISDKILSSLNTTDAKTRATVEQQLSKLAGEDFIKNNLAQGFKLFPDTAVYVGDSWTRKNPGSSDIKLDGTTTYTLVSVDNNIAKVETVSEIDNAGNTTKLMGYDVSTNIKGSQKGEFSADMQTGLVTHGLSMLSIKGTIQVLGKEVPATIKVTKEITGTKIK